MRILIIEDEKKLADSLKKALIAENYAVDTATDGQSGYEIAAVEPFDLIILDIGLPQMDGFEVCRKLRAEKITVPILLLTARDTINDKIIGLDLGADDYLVKPFEFEELLARIRALIRRSGPEPNIIFKTGSLELNTVSRRVTRKGEEINLTAKEYALLEYLMRYHNQILSKSRILEHVWDMATDPFTNLVDVYIGYLRNKIDRKYPKEKPLIQTVKGLGYRITA